MESVSRQAQVFVVAQFTLIVLVLVAARHLPQFNTLGSMVLAAGLLLGAWALAINRPDNFNINPTPREGATLCYEGPYRWVRHPMYMALMISLLGILLMGTGILSVLAWVALAFVLERKAAFEETMLQESSAEYASYCQQTRRFIPYLY